MIAGSAKDRDWEGTMQLITGGMGFIGLHTARAFLDAGEEVVVTRFRTARTPSFIEGEIGKRLFVETVDTTSPHDVIEAVRKYEADGIVHLAVPGLGALTPAEEYRVNMTGLINVLEAARLGKVRRVAIASSVGVYRALGEGPYHEDMALPLPASYATEAYKKAEEVLSLFYADRTGIEVVCLRIGGVYGPLYHSLSNLPSRMVHAAFRGAPGPLGREGRPPPHAEDQSDFFYVKDCAAAIRLVQSAPRLEHRVYNVSNGASYSAAELAQAVQKAVPGADIALAPGRGPGQPANRALDISRLVAETGYRPEFPLEAGIADYLAWLRAGNER